MYSEEVPKGDGSLHSSNKSFKEFRLKSFLQDANQSCHRVIKRLSLGKNAIVFKCIIDQHERDASRIRYLTMRQ